jgi:chemotaxis protein CheX
VLLPRLLNSEAAGSLKNELVAARGKPLALDASQVERVGGQCFQLLLAAKAAWSEDNMPLRVVNPTRQFTESVTLMGAGDFATQGGA